MSGLSELETRKRLMLYVVYYTFVFFLDAGKNGFLYVQKQKLGTSLTQLDSQTRGTDLKILSTSGRRILSVKRD